MSHCESISGGFTSSKHEVNDWPIVTVSRAFFDTYVQESCLLVYLFQKRVFKPEATVAPIVSYIKSIKSIKSIKRQASWS